MQIRIDTDNKTVELISPSPANYEEFTTLVDKIAEALQWPPDAVKVATSNAPPIPSTTTSTRDWPLQNPLVVPCSGIPFRITYTAHC